MNTFTKDELLELSKALLNTMDKLNEARANCSDVPEAVDAISYKLDKLQKLNIKVLSLTE